MKKNPILALVGLALLASGCSNKDKSAEVTPTPGPDSVSILRTLPAPSPARPAIPVRTQGGPIAGTSVAAEASDAWVSIKDYTFDQRAQFLAGAGRLESMLTSEVNTLTAKRASLPSTVDMKDWDFAMKEMTDSQSYLQSMVSEAAQATPDTWDQEKEKVDQAWQRAQAAFDKVKVTITS